MPDNAASTKAQLDRIVESHRQSPAVWQKAAIGRVLDVLPASNWVEGPGDDAAAIASRGTKVLAAGEAVSPQFLAVDPFGAGIAAVVANVNDVAAMGGRCRGIIDTVVGPETVAREVLRGLSWGAKVHDVPILGGHLTIEDREPSLSAFAVGDADRLLASSNAVPGHVLVFAGCLEGDLRPDFPFLPSFRVRGDLVPGDLDLMPTLAEAGDAVAAKDISMAGLLGSLAMLLEPSGCGVAIDLDRLPRPGGVDLETWLGVFPSFGFLICTSPDRVDAVVDRFHGRGLAGAALGVLDGTGTLRVRSGPHERTVAQVHGATGIRAAKHG